MKHLIKYVTMAALVLSVVACSQDDEINEQDKTPLAVITRGGSSTNDPYKAFEAGQQIRVYYAHSNLNTVYEHLQGVYVFPENKTKDDYWDDTLLNPKYNGGDLYSIFTEDIKAPNNDGKYFFTATSYPEPLAAGYDYLYEVAQDQSTSEIIDGITIPTYQKSDFVASRAVYNDRSWENDGILLKFRHLLCRIDVEIVLPKSQQANDGMFKDPLKLKPSADLLSIKTQYSVLFNNLKTTADIFDIKIYGDAKDIVMYPDPDRWAKKVDYNGVEAASFTFSAILPEQALADREGAMMRFHVDGDTYLYKVDTDHKDLITLKQEQVTQIKLIMLVDEGSQKLTLGEVKLLDWKDNTAHIGEMIPTED